MSKKIKHKLVSSRELVLRFGLPTNRCSILYWLHAGYLPPPDKQFKNEMFWREEVVAKLVEDWKSGGLKKCQDQ